MYQKILDTIFIEWMKDWDVAGELRSSLHEKIPNFKEIISSARLVFSDDSEMMELGCLMFHQYCPRWYCVGSVSQTKARIRILLRRSIGSDILDCRDILTLRFLIDKLC